MFNILILEKSFLEIHILNEIKIAINKIFLLFELIEAGILEEKHIFIVGKLLMMMVFVQFMTKITRILNAVKIKKIIYFGSKIDFLTKIHILAYPNQFQKFAIK